MFANANFQVGQDMYNQVPNKASGKSTKLQSLAFFFFFFVYRKTLLGKANIALLSFKPCAYWFPCTNLDKQTGPFSELSVSLLFSCLRNENLSVSQQSGMWYGVDYVSSKHSLRDGMWIIAAELLEMPIWHTGWCLLKSAAGKVIIPFLVFSVRWEGRLQYPLGFLFTITITHKQLSHIVFSILSSIRCGTTE